MQATGLRSLPRNNLGLIPVEVMAEAARASRTRVLQNVHKLPEHAVIFTKKPTQASRRPDQFMTLAEANRLLEKKARIKAAARGVKTHLQLVDLFCEVISLNFGTDVDGFEENSNKAIDTHAVAFCSAKAAHHEMCSTLHRKAIKGAGPCDEFWNARQPRFKGRERKARWFPLIQVGSIDPNKQGKEACKT